MPLQPAGQRSGPDTILARCTQGVGDEDAGALPADQAVGDEEGAAPLEEEGAVAPFDEDGDRDGGDINGDGDGN